MGFLAGADYVRCGCGAVFFDWSRLLSVFPIYSHRLWKCGHLDHLSCDMVMVMPLPLLSSRVVFVFISVVVVVVAAADVLFDGPGLFLFDFDWNERKTETHWESKRQKPYIMHARHFDHHQVFSVFQTFSTMQTKRSGKMRPNPHRTYTHVVSQKHQNRNAWRNVCYQYNLNMRMCKSSSISINRLIVYKRHPSIHIFLHIKHFFDSK